MMIPLSECKIWLLAFSLHYLALSLCSVNSLEPFELCCFLPVKDLTHSLWCLRCKRFRSFGLTVLDLYLSFFPLTFSNGNATYFTFLCDPLTSKALYSSLAPTLRGIRYQYISQYQPSSTYTRLGRQGTIWGLCLSAKAFTVGEIAEAPLNIPHWYRFSLDG